MVYVDGFVLPVPKKNLKKYVKMAQGGAKLWKKHGAIGYYECVGDDLKPDMGGMKCANFPALARAKPGETVFYSFIIYRSRAHRDSVNKKVMNDPAMNDPKNKEMKMPFDVKRMAYGGFRAVVEG